MSEVVRRGPGGLAWLADQVADTRGWLRAALAVGLGVAATAALPPIYALPLLLVAFPGLIWLLDGARRATAAFAVGWYFGVGHFGTGFYWIANALLTDPERYGWMVPFAIAGLAAGFAIFTGLVALLVWLLRAKGVRRVLVFAAAWTTVEWLRGWILTGFPWNPIGNVWAFDAAPLQLAAFTGVYGLTLVTVLAAAMPAALRRGPALIALALPLAAWVAGGMRIADAMSDRAGERLVVPGIRLAIVQPNVAQEGKWDDASRRANLEKLIALGSQGLRGAATHVVFPETAVPYVIAGNEPLLRVLASVIPPGGALLTGAIRAEGQGASLRLWNSLHAIDSAGHIVATYDKAHLVPFGEYVPLRGILPIDKLTYGAVDYSAGPGPRTLAVPGAPPVGPLICYEAIFPGAVADASVRPAWLLNVTNDAWFGVSSGPYQHFASARLRAVEEGLPFVRAANTGISGVIDPYGRITARLGLGREGVLDAALPAALGGPTLFGRFGNLIALILVAACAVAGIDWRLDKRSVR
jgi:apolipoprotein N-acyltransferase